MCTRYISVSLPLRQHATQTRQYSKVSYMTRLYRCTVTRCECIYKRRLLLISASIYGCIHMDVYRGIKIDRQINPHDQ